MIDIENAIVECDISLFAPIPSQSSDEDKRSLLACQSAVRTLRPGYVYLEIGSHLGGSIQPHLLDPKCTQIYSIDKRPSAQPDERGLDFVYENNSTARMMENLKLIQEDVSKIITMDGASTSIAPDSIEEKADLCFIDGEHTDKAVFSDFRFCLEVLSANGAILFHDSQIVYNGIIQSLDHLDENEVTYRAYVLPNVVFVVEIGDFPIHQNEKIRTRLLDNRLSYLFALKENDHYRRFTTRPAFKLLRRLRSAIKLKK